MTASHANMGRLLLFCLVVFGSRTAWYDTRVVFESLLFSSAMRKIFMVYALCLSPFVLIAFRNIDHVFKSPLIVLYLVLNLYGVALAAAYGNSLIYTAQDAFKLLLVPTGFILVYYDPPRSADALVDKLAKVVLGYQAIKFAIYLTCYQSTFGFVYGGVTDAFGLCIFAARLFSDDRRTSFQDLLLAGTSLLLITLGQKRMLVVCVFVIVLYLLSRNYVHIMKRLWPYAAIAACLFAGVLFRSELYEILQSDQFRRLAKTDVANSIGEESQRQREVRLVYEDLEAIGWTAYVLGIGHGAVYEEEIAQRKTGEYVTHSIHFTPAGMHFRYGFFGLTVYGLTALYLVFGRFLPVEGWLSLSTLRGVRAFGLCVIVASLTGFGLIDDLMVGSILGIMMLSCHLQPVDEPIPASKPATIAKPIRQAVRPRRVGAPALGIHSDAVLAPQHQVRARAEHRP